MHDLKRIEEAGVYVGEYTNPSYRMGQQRQDDVQRILKSLKPGSLLDVGTGRGETLDFAAGLGFWSLTGTETVPSLLSEKVVHAYSVDLPFPDKSYDIVTCFDVMEHLIEEDLVPTIKEFCRVAKSRILLSCSEISSSQWGGGRDLHISKRSAYAWMSLIVSAAEGWLVEQRGTAGGSPVFILSQ